MTPHLISWNVTYRCNLRCPHCYLDAGTEKQADDLSTAEALVIVDQIAALAPGAMLIFSGGEPLLRPDLASLVRRASRQGLMAMLGTNGTLLDEAALLSLTSAGLAGAGISLDGADPAYHDAFRGKAGAWQEAVRAMQLLRQHRLPFQVQATLTRANSQQLHPMIDLSQEMGASAFSLFFLVCTGRGESLCDITPQEYEAALQCLARLQSEYPAMKVRARCAPHFTRILAEQASSEAELPVGCLAGSYYLRITPEGQVTPCPYLPMVLGDLRHQELSQIWKTSPVLAELRAEPLGGRCGACAFSQRCRGCRARAYALSQDYLAEDPWCTYQPTGKTEIPQTIPWQEAAHQRMQRAPAFIRARVMAHIEAYARHRGYPEITVEVLEETKANLPSHKLPFSHR